MGVPLGRHGPSGIPRERRGCACASTGDFLTSMVKVLIDVNYSVCFIVSGVRRSRPKPSHMYTPPPMWDRPFDSYGPI